MRVLVVTNVYLPKWLNPKQSSFVRDQIALINKYHPDVEFTLYTIRGNENKFSYVKSIWEVYKLTKSGKFDLIHIHYGISGLFLLFTPKPPIPVIMTLHGGDIQIEQGKKKQVALTKKIIKKCNYVISLSERMKGIVEEYNKRTSIIPISVDTEFFLPNHHTREGVVKIIFPGSLDRTVKNHPLFLETVDILQNKYGYKVKEIDFDNISREEVRDNYRTADLVLLTSISEGSPGVIKEGMACNLPIVSTNVGDVASNLEGVANCAVAHNMDAEELALLCDKCLKNEISGITGREKLAQLGFDDKTICDKIYSLYKELTK